MGASGYGMQHNDDAMDAIGEYQEFVDDDNEDIGFRLVLHLPTDIKAAIEAQKGDNWAILGLSEWLMDNGCDVSPAYDTIEIALQEEMHPDVISGWRSPRERFEALHQFQMRVVKQHEWAKVISEGAL